MPASRNKTAFVFDLDGTLVDSVYQHVLAWREALERYGIELELATGRGAALAKKIADEFRAGLRLTDVHTGGSAPIIFGLTGMLEPVETQFYSS